VNVVGKIKRENVSSISFPLRLKGRNGLVLAPWSGAPNQSVVGGPPSHSAIKRGWGLSYGPPWAHYLGGYQDRLLGGPLGLPGLRYTVPEGVEHKDYGGEVLG
jgi:hypothetical protein